MYEKCRPKCLCTTLEPPNPLTVRGSQYDTQGTRRYPAVLAGWPDSGGYFFEPTKDGGLKENASAVSYRSALEGRLGLGLVSCEPLCVVNGG